MKRTRRLITTLSHFALLCFAWLPFHHLAQTPKPDAFLGKQAGDAREVSGVRLVWCPPGRFRMGSPANEVERR